MKRLYPFVFVISMGSIQAFSQVEAPFNRDFYTNNTGTYSEAKRIILSKNPGNDSRIALINKLYFFPFKGDNHGFSNN